MIGSVKKRQFVALVHAQHATDMIGRVVSESTDGLGGERCGVINSGNSHSRDFQLRKCGQK